MSSNPQNSNNFGPDYNPPNPLQNETPNPQNTWNSKPQEQFNQPNQFSPNQMPPTPTKKNGAPWVLIIVIFLILIIFGTGGIGLFLLLTFSPGGENPEETIANINNNYDKYVAVTDNTQEVLEEIESARFPSSITSSISNIENMVEEQVVKIEDVQDEHDELSSEIEEGSADQAKTYYEEVSTNLDESKVMLDQFHSGFLAVSCSLAVADDLQDSSQEFIDSMSEFSLFSQYTSETTVSRVLGEAKSSSQDIANTLETQISCLEGADGFYDNSDISPLRDQYDFFTEVSQVLEDIERAYQDQNETAFTAAINRFESLGNRLDSFSQVDFEGIIADKFEGYYDFVEESQDDLLSKKEELVAELS
jgi:hypothetical protein